MVLRFAYLGLVIASLAGPALAGLALAGPALAVESSGLDQPAGNGFVLDQDGGKPAARKWRRHARRAAPAGETAAEPSSDPAIAIDEAPAARPKLRAPSRRSVAVMPPERPTEAPAAIASADLSAATAPVPGSASPASSAPAVEAEIGTPPAGATTVAVLPPLRPSLPGDDPVAADAASALPDVMTTPSGKFVYVMPPARPAFRTDAGPTAPGEAAMPSEVPAPASPEPSLFSKLFGSPVVASPSMLPALAGSGRGHNGIDGLVTTYARLNGVPEALVHRVIIRESKYNPRAVGSGGALGLMQIKHATARGLGYSGPASGLLDAETNITYAVKYLAGAYRTAGGDFDRSVQYYARGYYYAAKRQGGAVRVAGRGRRGERQEAEARSDDNTVVAAVQQ